MPRQSSESGFIPLLVLGLVIAGGLFGLSQYQVVKHPADGKANVAGVQSAGESAKLLTANGKTAVVQGHVGALSDYSINQAGRVTVKTPNGEKQLLVLPEDAAKGLLSSRAMSEIDSIKAEGSLASVNRLVKLEEKNNVLGYEVQGYRKHKVLGLIPANTKVSAFVSAENGQVTETRQSLLGRILNKVSP